MELVKTIFRAISRILFLILSYCLLASFTLSCCFLILFCFCELTNTTDFLFEVLNFISLHKTFTIVIFVIVNCLGFIYFIYCFTNNLLKANPDLINLLEDKGDYDD